MNTNHELLISYTVNSSLIRPQGRATMALKFPLAKTQAMQDIEFLFTMANRHGLITGATGTGKTVTLQAIIEQFSKVGIPVFVPDIKGEMAGLALAGGDNKKINARFAEFQIQPDFHGFPVDFWDLKGLHGHPLRTTVSEMGPLLFGRILQINEIQQGIVNAAFSYADDHGLLLLDLKDFRSILNWMKNNAASLTPQYGNFTSSSIGAIQRSLLTLEENGGDLFFGEPAFELDILLEKTNNGSGKINILDATELVNNGLLYSSFLLWLLSELFETLPEVGDLEKPKLAFFFDEAHLLFDSAPKPLLEKITQLVRLIRSKGIGVYFVTQNPLDVPDKVLGQLGNRVQHALRGYTPKDQKAIKAAAETFRQNAKIDTEKAISELGVGEALISLLDARGTPSEVEQGKIIPPVSRLGTISSAERKAIIRQSPYFHTYDKAVDRESAYEMLEQRTQAQLETATVEGEKKQRGRPRQTLTEAIITSAARSASTQLGRQIMRGILGSIFGRGK